MMALTGQGELNLLKEDCDMLFNVRVLGGWKGESKLIDRLKQTAIPLRIYGNWQTLSYSLQVDQILRKQLQDEARKRLSEWAERNKNTQDGKGCEEAARQTVSWPGKAEEAHYAQIAGNAHSSGIADGARLRGPTANEGCVERLGFVGRVRR